MSDFKVQFAQKPLDAIQTVAELLSYARIQQGEDLEEIARHLQISPFYLEALEEGAYGKLPSFIYSRNFVKSYGLYLGLRVEPLLELFKQEWELFDKHQPQLPHVAPRKRGVARSDLWRMPRWMRWIASSAIVAGIFVYFGLELYSLRQPPELSVYAPEPEVVTEKQIVQISGKTEPEVALLINDQTILSDIEGNFSETIALQPGLNIIEIEAKKKYSRENIIYRKVIVQEKSTVTELPEQENRL